MKRKITSEQKKESNYEPNDNESSSSSTI
jgi:hypothetical protein